MKGDIYTRVRQMLPVAKRLIAEGIDDRRAEWTDAIPCADPPANTEAELVALMKWTEAVYATGIAIGLSLNPDIVRKVGGR